MYNYHYFSTVLTRNKLKSDDVIISLNCMIHHRLHIDTRTVLYHLYSTTLCDFTCIKHITLNTNIFKIILVTINLCLLYFFRKDRL